MPYAYPGVYIQELTSPVHAITGVATSITAFVGYTSQGIDNQAQAIFSFADFQRLYGGLAPDSEVSYAVSHFYQNAPGAQAYVVRVPKRPASQGDQATASVEFGGLTFTALSSGAWANNALIVDVDQGAPADLTADPTAFNLTVTNLTDGTSESFPALSLDSTRTRYVTAVINDPDNGSRLVKVSGTPTSTSPPLAASGIVGTAPPDLGALAAPHTSTAAADWGFQLGVTAPSSVQGLPVTVTVFPEGTPLPQGVIGIASAMQRALATALAAAVPGASVQCSLTAVPTGTASAPSNGQALRISVTLPGVPDAVLTLEPLPDDSSDTFLAALGLKLAAGAAFNVAHYTLGSGHTTAMTPSWGHQTASTPAASGVTAPNVGDLTGALAALDRVDLFNLLSIPDATRADLSSGDAQQIYSQAIAYCAQRRAFLLVDPPAGVTTVPGAIDWISGTLGITDPNGAAFWPRVRLPDPLNSNSLRTFAPSGVVAGVYAASDANRGVWKAPAGINATLNGVPGLSYSLTDDENGELNPLGLNCLRSFPVYGRVLWGARTLQGADALASQWKYVPVRRLALYLEESLFRGLQWVVFEPNDAPLWAAIRLNVESFLDTLFRKGAFAGTTAAQAYFVKCDSETTTPSDIANGIVNVLVGFAPLEPAEFVVLQLEQLAGQA
jgi:uncharacterized protein